MPSIFYTDPETYQRTISDIFSNSWQFITHASTLRENNVHPFTLLKDSLNEPLVITKNNEEITCLTNVCTHRAHIVCQKAESASRLQCKYHGRTFDLGGKVNAIHGFEGAKNCPSEKDDLQKIQLKHWNGFIFSSLDPSINISPVLEDIENRLNWFPFDKITYNEKLSTTFHLDAHWALYCENFLEGMHIPYVHKGLAKTIDCSSYVTELLENGVLQNGALKDGQGEHHAHYYWIFPNLMLNFYTWGLSINIVEPITQERTRVRFLTYVIDDNDPSKDIRELEQVELEDESVVNSVQRGIKSRLYSRGRYAPKHEQGVHYFHQLLSHHLS